MKRTMTGKLIALAAALMLVLALFAGCGTPAAEQPSAAPAASTETSAEVSSSPTDAPSYTIGITQIVEHPSLDLCRQGAIDKLAELGFVEGQNLTIDYKSAQGEHVCRYHDSPAVRIRQGKRYNGYIHAERAGRVRRGNGQDSRYILGGIRPAAAGFANEDGSNMAGVTGTSDALPVEAMLEIIKRFTPDAVNVGILHCTSEVNSDVQLRAKAKSLPPYGMKIVDVGITSTNEMATALDTLLPKVDVVMNLTDNTVVSALALEIQKCNEAKNPLYGSEDTQVKNGALASAGIDYYVLGQKTGEMIAEILNGKAAAEIPVADNEAADTIC